MSAAETTLKMLLLGEDRSLSKTLKGAGDAAGEVGHKFTGVGTLVKGALAAGAGLAIVKFGKDSVDAFKNVGFATLSMQRRIGGTPESVSRLNFALHESGIQAETAQKGFGIFEKNLAGAATSSQKSGLMVKQLGFEFRDAHGHVKPMSDILPQVADRFAKMPAGAEKTALAMKLFGKSGADLLPFLNKGSVGIAELERESDRLGHTLSGKDLDAIKENKKAHREWNAAVEGVKIQFGSQLLPILNQFMQFLVAKGIPVLASFIKGMKDGTGPGGRVRDVLRQVHEIASKFLTFVGGHVGVLSQMSSGLSGILVVTKVSRAVGQLFSLLRANPIMAVVTLLSMLALYLIHAYQTSSTFRAIVDGAFKAIGAAARWLWNNVMSPVLRFIINGFATVVDWVGNFLDALSHIPGFGWARDAAAKMHDAAGAARGLASSIRSIPDANVNVRVGLSGPGVALLHQQQARKNPNVFFGFASGVKNAPAGWAWVGEEGPELMYVPGGSTILPHNESTRATQRGGRMAGGGSDGGDINLTVNLRAPDGRLMQSELLRLKRTTGAGLGLG